MLHWSQLIPTAFLLCIYCIHYFWFWVTKSYYLLFTGLLDPPFSKFYKYRCLAYKRFQFWFCEQCRIYTFHPERIIRIASINHWQATIKFAKSCKMEFCESWSESRRPLHSKSLLNVPRRTYYRPLELDGSHKWRIFRNINIQQWRMGWFYSSVRESHRYCEYLQKRESSFVRQINKTSSSSEQSRHTTSLWLPWIRRFSLIWRKPDRIARCFFHDVKYRTKDPHCNSGGSVIDLQISD